MKVNLTSIVYDELVYPPREPFEDTMYRLTKYDPLLDNKGDRGEVKTLAYIAVEGMDFQNLFYEKMILWFRLFFLGLVPYL